MKIKGRESHAWHKNLIETVGPRKPVDSDFPWVALQNYTGYYMKKKGRLSQIQVDERLLALILKHPSKEIAIAACAHLMSVRTIRSLLVNDFKIEPDGAFGLQEYLHIIVATNHVSPGAVNDIEAQWAICLLENEGAGGSSRPLAQRLHDVLSLLPAQVSSDLLLKDDMKRLADAMCMDFANQLESLRRKNQWMDAHAAAEWLLRVSTSSSAIHIANGGTRNFPDDYLSTWGAWTAWQPRIPRLRAWQVYAAYADSSLEDLLALEGPDFLSTVGSQQTTLRNGLIAQATNASQPTLQWGKVHIIFSRNPFRELENINGILERLTRVIDFACSAGHEYTSLLAHLCGNKTISNEVLQILEGVQILGNPTFTTVILQVLAVPRENFCRVTEGIRQLLPALSDSRVCGLREQMQPYVVDRISNHVRKLRNTLFMQLGVGDQWGDAAMELLVFTHGLEEQDWLLVQLDDSVRRLIASGPSLMISIETLDAVRTSIRSTTISTPTPLLSQIDTYCKAKFMPGCTVDPQVCELIEALIILWHQDSDHDRRELTILIADLPNTGCQLRCDCLRDITTLNSSWVSSTLEALKLHEGSPDLGCFALIGLLASEGRPYILERWRKVLLFAIEKQHERLLRHAVTHMTISAWLELLHNIRVVYTGSEVIMGDHSPRLLSLELHTWSQQMAEYLPTLKHLEGVLKRGPAMQTLLLGSATTNNHHLGVLKFVKNSKSINHAKLMEIIVVRLHSRNADEIEDVLSFVSKAGLKGAETCLRVFESRRQIFPQLTEVMLASHLRASGISEPDRLALRKVARLFGIALDAEGHPSAASVKEVASSLHEKYLKLMAEAQRLENLRLSLRAIDPESVSKLLARLHIEAPPIADDAIASLPPSIGSLVERISKDEIELQFPATNLTGLQRFAIGAGDSESFLIHLTLGHNGAPTKFCVHLSAESSNQSNSRTFSNEKNHTSWEVFRGNRPPYEQYCYGRPNRGVYQLSRILWHHLRHDFKSLEQTHAHMTSKIRMFGQGCIVCGLGQRRLRRATVCPSPSCQSTFSQAHIEIQLAEIWQDPPVMDLLLSMIYATASTGKLDLLADCPASDAPAIVSMLHGLPAIPTLAKHLKSCLNFHGSNYRRAHALVGYCTQSTNSALLASSLLWVCTSYRGFLVSATKLQRIPFFGDNQYLLANTAPELELAFSRHISTLQSNSEILFHGTSLDRLHAILCQGLRVQSGTALQRHGAAHGAGIYMADEPSLAWGYATASPGGWKSSKLKNMKLLLGCELAGSKPKASYAGIYVITDATRLAVRYIFLLESNAKMPAAKDVKTPMQSVFQSLKSGTL